MGSMNSCNSGLTVIFITPKTRVKTAADCHELMLTPGNTFEKANTVIADRMNFKIKFIRVFYDNITHNLPFILKIQKRKNLL